jgi:hypothetical protein
VVTGVAREVMVKCCQPSQQAADAQVAPGGVIFPVIVSENYRSIVFADGRRFLYCRVFEDRQVGVVHLTWLG